MFYLQSLTWKVLWLSAVLRGTPPQLAILPLLPLSMCMGAPRLTQLNMWLTLRPIRLVASLLQGIPQLGPSKRKGAATLPTLARPGRLL